jgi:hypothetical protein
MYIFLRGSENMPFENVIKRAAIGATVALSLKGIRSDPKRSIRNTVDLFDCFTRGIFDESLLSRIRQDVGNPKSCLFNTVMAMVQNVDHSILKTVGTDLCYNRVAVFTNQKKPKKEILTRKAACKAAESLKDAVKYGKELGVYFYVISGHRPLNHRNEILAVCRDNPDCAFFLQMDEKDVDEDFVKEAAKAENIILSVNVCANFFSDQLFQKYSQTFRILKKHHCLYGYSVRIDAKKGLLFCQKKFIDLMVKCGCLFGWYFNGFEEKQPYFKAVRSMIRSASTAGSPLLLLNKGSDDRLTERFTAGGRCYLFFGKKRLKIKYRLAAAKNGGAGHA